MIKIETEITTDNLAMALAKMSDMQLWNLAMSLMDADEYAPVRLWHALTSVLDQDLRMFCPTCQKWLPDGHPIPDDNAVTFKCPHCETVLTDDKGRPILGEKE